MGGPVAMRDKVFAHCSGSMRSWFALNVNVVNVEFPEWEILMAFQIFDLSRRCAESCGVKPLVNEAFQQHFERIAMFLRLDLQMLINQFEDFAPAAIQQYKLMDVNANWLLAWQSAVAHVQE